MGDPKPLPSNDDARLAAAANIIARLRGAGHDAFLVGGCVRDLVMGAAPDDYDIATNARPESVQKLFPRTRAVGASFGVVLVIEDDVHYEVATFRSDGEYIDGRRPQSVTYSTAEEDAQRRDFTINALLMDPATGDVIDHVGGRADIDAKIIRAIGDPAARFEEDHLRLIRAVRFAARLGFEIEPDTWNALKANAEKIRTVAAERIRDELLKILTRPNPGRALTLLHECGILEEILPEVAACAGVEQPPKWHPEGDVFVHTALVVDNAQATPAEIAPVTPALAFAALLHDVGKVPTAQKDETGRWRFNCHDEVGARMAEEICQRLRVSRRETEQVTALVASHMKFMHVQNMRESRLKRFLGMDGFADHLALHRADCLASHGKLDNLDFCMQKLVEIPPEVIRPEPIITGNDLIALGLKPGPDFKRILEAVQDAQLEGEISTKDEAVALAKELA